jgi:hypothetical protein
MKTKVFDPDHIRLWITGSGVLQCIACRRIIILLFRIKILMLRLDPIPNSLLKLDPNPIKVNADPNHWLNFVYHYRYGFS